MPTLISGNRTAHGTAGYLVQEQVQEEATLKIAVCRSVYRSSCTTHKNTMRMRDCQAWSDVGTARSHRVSPWRVLKCLSEKRRRRWRVAMLCA